MAILGGIFGKSSDDRKRDALKKAEQEAIRNAEKSIGLAEDYESRLSDQYQPLIDRGLENFNEAYDVTGQLTNNRVPQYNELGSGGLSDLYQNMNQGMYRPEFQQYQAATYNEDPTSSPQYQALMDTSAEFGGGLAGGLANQYNYDVAQRDFNNQLAQNQLGQQSNQYLNQVNNQAMNQGMGLEQYLQNLNQTNYKNQVGNYGAQRQQLADQLGQYNWMNKMGNDAMNKRNAYGQDILSSRIGTLSGDTNATMSNLANQLQLESQKQANTMSMIGNAGSAMANYLGSNWENPFKPQANNSMAGYDWNQYSNPFGTSTGVQFNAGNLV
jgi:small-conductance mechanosensitive channel